MKTFITSIAALSLSVVLFAACSGGEKPAEPTAAPMPAATPTAAPVAASPVASPAAAAPAEAPADPGAAAPTGDKKDEKTVASAPKNADMKAAVSLAAQGDKARALASEIRGLTEELRKLAGDIDAQSAAVMVTKAPAAIEATEKLIASFKEKSQALDAKSKNLKSLIADMDAELAKVK